MHRARLHLAAADDGLGSAAGTTAGFTAATAALRALVHVQLARLHGAAATGRGTATPGTLYASPHPLHSKTGVRLTINHPTPSSIRRIARARDHFDPLRATSVVLGSPGDDTPFWSTVVLCAGPRYLSRALVPCSWRFFPPNARGRTDKSGRLPWVKGHRWLLSEISHGNILPWYRREFASEFENRKDLSNATW